MQLTITTDYAIRIVCYLAKKQQMTSAAELAQELQIPISYIPKVTRQLKKAQIITAMEGTHGGYSLIKKTDDIQYRVNHDNQPMPGKRRILFQKCDRYL